MLFRRKATIAWNGSHKGAWQFYGARRWLSGHSGFVFVWPQKEVKMSNTTFMIGGQSVIGRGTPSKPCRQVQWLTDYRLVSTKWEKINYQSSWLGETASTRKDQINLLETSLTEKVDLYEIRFIRSKLNNLFNSRSLMPYLIELKQSSCYKHIVHWSSRTTRCIRKCHENLRSDQDENSLA